MGYFRFRQEEMLRRTYSEARYTRGGVVELAESIPGVLLNGIGTEPMGHAGLEDLYYVKEGRNELLGIFVPFIPARKTDRSIEIISPRAAPANLNEARDIPLPPRCLDRTFTRR